MGAATRKDLVDKKVYRSLAAALEARAKVARERGGRWKHCLRIYKVAEGWCLTRQSRSHYEWARKGGE
jgi:hypothetical protein